MLGVYEFFKFQQRRKQLKLSPRHLTRETAKIDTTAVRHHRWYHCECGFMIPLGVLTTARCLAYDRNIAKKGQSS
jgi:hypothetical protein